jgi:hypothetical protein
VRWTIILLTPIWYNARREYVTPMVNIKGLLIGSLHVTLLSAIQVGLSCAVEACMRIGDHLVKLLGGEDIFLDPEKHDKLCFYDHTDLSQSKKCFWVINSVDKFHQSIQDTIYQWEWFYTTHIEHVKTKRLDDKNNDEYQRLTKLCGEIGESNQKLKDQSERFLAIQKQAKDLRDGVCSITLLPSELIRC